MARGKISQLDPKGSNIDPTDLFEVSVNTGSGYDTYSITGQELIDGAITIYNSNSSLTSDRTITMDNHYLSLDGGNNVCRFILDADNNKGRLISFRTDNTQRFAIRVDGNESGSNAGADFAIRRYNDAGSYVDSPLTIRRSDGNVNIKIVFRKEAASYTLVEADAGMLIEMEVSTANTLTIPTNASVPFPLGTQILVSQLGTGQTTITPAGGVTLRSSGGKTKTSAQYSMCTLIKRGTNEWYLAGDITT